MNAPDPSSHRYLQEIDDEIDGLKRKLKELEKIKAQELRNLSSTRK